MKKRHDSLLYGVCCANSEAKSRRLLAGFAVLLIAAMFTLAGCEQPTDGGGGADDPASKAFSVAGTFTKSGSSDTVKFSLKSDAAALLSSALASVSRTITTDSYSLSGELEDDDLIIRLRGSYDPETGNWSVSARDPGEDGAIYTGAGNVDDEGESLGSNAIIAARSSGQWVAGIAPVTEEEVSITGTAAEGASGLPSALQGYWYSREEGASSLSALVSDWKILLSGTDPSPEGIPMAVSRDCTVLEVSGNGPYEITYCYPKYQMTTENLRDALADFLGLGQSDIKVVTRYPYDESITESDRRVYVMNEPSYDIIYLYPEGFSAEELRLVEAFHAIGGYATWAAQNSITQTTKYEKIKVTLAGGQFTLTSLAGGTGPSYTYNYDSLEDLEAATLTEVDDDIQGQYMKRTLHR